MGRLRLLSAGESHGPKIAAILEGLPAGLDLDLPLIQRDLKRRQAGYGRGARSRAIEQDEAVFPAGVRFGETLGGPVLLEIENRDHRNWLGVMEAGAVSDRSKAEAAALHRPRPGHADLPGHLKYQRGDIRDVLERASARTTCVRVAAGAVAKCLLSKVGVHVYSLVTRIGGVGFELPEDLEGLEEAAEADELRCPDPLASQEMRKRIDEARKAGDTVGGSFLVVATGAPPGWGSYVEWDRRLDGRLAQAVMSIQGIKAVEIGLGVRNADIGGAEAHDEIYFESGPPDAQGSGYVRPTNRAGGLEGGMTNGEDLLVRGTMKPIATLARPLASVDVLSKESVEAAYERSDICAVPACGVIAEAAVALCLADAALECYGGDTIQDFVDAHQRWLSRLGKA